MNVFTKVLLLVVPVIFSGAAKTQPANPARLKAFAKEARAFCKSRNLDRQFYILIDLGMHSGLKRFFLWDLQKDTVIAGFLVSHGCGSQPWGGDGSREGAVVSNTDGSHCSSAGKYIIGERSYSNWGIHVKYSLLGQERTNSNAVKRDIVFHSWEMVPDREVYPAGTPEGWGCPAISNAAMSMVDKRIRGKRILMWIVR